MPKGYLVAHIDVRDAEGFEAFKKKSGPVIAEYGGTVLARDPASNRREGKLGKLTILIEFASLERAREFYLSEGYTEARLLREKIADTQLVLFEGL